MICRRNGFHGVEPWGSPDYIVDGKMIDHREIDDFCDLLDHDRELDRTESHRYFAQKTSQWFLRGGDFPEFDFHPFESVAEDDINCASCVDEDSRDF